jgi:hypothetical protein
MLVSMSPYSVALSYVVKVVAKTGFRNEPCHPKNRNIHSTNLIATKPPLTVKRIHYVRKNAYGWRKKYLVKIG